MTQPSITVAVAAVMLHCNAAFQQIVMGQTFAVAPCNATCTNIAAYQRHEQEICSIDCTMQPHASQRAVHRHGWSHTLEP